MLGVIADDFTGASDVANTLSRGGLATALAFGTAPGELPEGFDACVVGMKTRSITAGDAVAQSLRCLDDLQRLGADRFQFKYCSTFDSTPAGNIGPVTEALAERLGVSGPVVLCPAFPDAGRTVFEGHLFVFDRLLNQSGMERHPINPMTDADIRRWLALQVRGDVGHLSHEVIRRGAAAARQRLVAEAQNGRRLVIADAVDNDALLILGEAIADDVLITGASGIAMGVGRQYRRRTGAHKVPPMATVTGPALVLSGSCSATTLEQVATYCAGHPSFAVKIDALMNGETTAKGISEFIHAHWGSAPIVYSSALPEQVEEGQRRYGAATLAQHFEALFASVGAKAVEEGVTRLVVAGGETSGAIVGGLSSSLFQVGPEIDIGVPALRAIGHPLALALKSGNFGGPAFFETALRALEKAQ
ncbi:MAG TPA: 3-oxo-tetronate kinase [Bauldia sp.]|nr:3-oxo-tetronate kinase [Bauldia sp.]